ncbi:replication associated protein [Bovine faeces associated smacovirus 3]|uniref:Replication associated protein n=1 Tax=Bovine faeces associated smacovirus 3 TaxID=1843751 RepID=A0A161I5M0_9VIRU|nr:replication associated protein [Bovine faeces associated smacovirus 3]ANC51531.1 replication associated protein [Bovine faeces associated smacovirus 3]
MGKYSVTISADLWKERDVVRLLDMVDLREYYIGREIGKGGYHHYQCAIDCGGDLERFNGQHQLGWHIEDCASWDKLVRYCRKGGDYRYIGDSIEEQSYRSRGTTAVGHTIDTHLKKQNDRQISICVDTKGGSGKTTHGYDRSRTGEYFVVPRNAETPTRIMDYVAMNYDNEPVIWIDLPRTRKIDKGLATILEDMKDGLIYSAKYEGQVRHIKGVKVLVTTNHYIEKPAYKLLSADRWDVFTPPTKAGDSRDGNTGLSPLGG